MKYSIFVFLLLLINALAQKTTIQTETTTSPSITTTLETPTTTTIELIDKNEYVVNFDYFIRQEQIPNIVVNAILKETTIPNSDIIKLFKLNDVTIDSFLAQFINKITSNLSFPDALKKLLNLVDMDFYVLYSSLTKGLTSEQSRNIIRNLKIDDMKFAYAYTYRETDIFEILRTGNYSQENVAFTLNEADLSQEELFDLVKKVVISNLRQMPKGRLQEVLKQMGVTVEMLFVLWNEAQITIEDVYAAEAVRDYLTNLVTTWSAKNIIGVAVNENAILLHKDNYEEFRKSNILKQFVVIAKSLTNNEARGEVVGYNNLRTASIAELTITEFIGDTITIGYQYTQLQNCTYIVTVNNVAIPVEVVIENDDTTIKITQDLKLLFQKGAPLVCNNVLYGMAREKRNNTIEFSIFYAPVKPSHSLSTSIKKNQNSCIFLYGVYIIFSIVYYYL